MAPKSTQPSYSWSFNLLSGFTIQYSGEYSKVTLSQIDTRTNQWIFAAGSASAYFDSGDLFTCATEWAVKPSPTPFFAYEECGSDITGGRSNFTRLTINVPN